MSSIHLRSILFQYEMMDDMSDEQILRWIIYQFHDVERSSLSDVMSEEEGKDQSLCDDEIRSKRMEKFKLANDILSSLVNKAIKYIDSSQKSRYKFYENNPEKRPSVEDVTIIPSTERAERIVRNGKIEVWCNNCKTYHPEVPSKKQGDQKDQEEEEDLVVPIPSPTSFSTNYIEGGERESGLAVITPNPDI